MSSSQREELPYFTRVEIGGRTMLAPGFSLVGLTGIVWMRSPEAPPGCVTVMIDWLSQGYTPESGHPLGSLPECVNVPAMHLHVLDEEVSSPEPLSEPAKTPEKPKFDMVEGKKSGEKTDEEPSEKPKLRLI